MNNYWVDRLDEQNRRLLDKTEAQIMRQLIKLYEHALLVLKKDIKQLYADIITNQVNDTISIADFYAYDRYYKLANDLNTNLAHLNKSSIELLEDKFEKMYVDSQLVLNKLNKNWSNDYIRDPRPVINSVWTTDGKNWSSRVWVNTSNMEEKIMGVLVDCFSRGVAVDKTVASIAEEFKSSIYAARRLVITELSRIQCQSLLDDFVAHNIEKYKIIGADDDKTCEVCQHMIGKIFYVKDAIPGVNLPPLHPNGRCSIAPILA